MASRIAEALLGLCLLTAPVYVQTNGVKKGLSLDASVASNRDESHTFRAEGFYTNGRTDVMGFIDNYGKESNKFYAEVYVRRGFGKRFDLQFETNDGSGIPATYRLGTIFDIPSPSRRIYANTKILPLNFGSQGIAPELQIGTFLSVNIGKGWHAENWTDFNLFRTKAPRVLSEATVTKRIKGSLYAVFRASYKVNTEGFGFRAGVRYKILN